MKKMFDWRLVFRDLNCAEFLAGFTWLVENQVEFHSPNTTPKGVARRLLSSHKHSPAGINN